MEVHNDSKIELLLKFIQQNPFATIILGGKDLLPTHTPVLSTNSDEYLLFGQIPKDNPQYKYLENGKSVLIIFELKDSYLPGFHKDDELEDYSSIHVNGQIKLQTEQELKSSLNKTFKMLRDFYNYNDEEYPINNEIIEKQIDLVTGFYCKPSLINPIKKLKQGF